MHYVKLNPCEGLGSLIFWVLLFTFVVRELLMVYKPNFILTNVNMVVNQMAYVDEKWTLLYSVVIALVLTLALSAINSRM